MQLTRRTCLRARAPPFSNLLKSTHLSRGTSARLVPSSVLAKQLASALHSPLRLQALEAVSFCSFFCAATPYNKAPILNAPIRSQYHFPPDCFPTPPRRRGAPGGKTSSKKALRLFVLTVMITLQRFSSRLWRGVSLYWYLITAQDNNP